MHDICTDFLLTVMRLRVFAMQWEFFIIFHLLHLSDVTMLLTLLRISLGLLQTAFKSFFPHRILKPTLWSNMPSFSTSMTSALPLSVTLCTSGLLELTVGVVQFAYFEQQSPILVQAQALACTSALILRRCIASFLMPHELVMQHVLL